jgi:hypothetical protein
MLKAFRTYRLAQPLVNSLLAQSSAVNSVVANKTVQLAVNKPAGLHTSAVRKAGDHEYVVSGFFRI